ncbi:hypothetical protein AM493_18170 [Flavobacterium akiainvivens]|uniref:Outer membrane protein beta-barrel domain-containing protein n=1 Tax=Flavobacterium akiainvivens TaxID=1202724 RepID=A0A0M8MJZ5_9FLAO|nr:hypothetical protein [Flavobacterium akiainvivens]KOS07761.1 hypothetical protein AM493_18170 [Flavobacterium akiainvivens]SFQ25784.1 hypothetical protein SAMN05444144_102215 [Flavobacterium akiainvivens]
MKKILIFLILLAVSPVHAQQNRGIERDSTITDTTRYARFVAEAGVRIPLGRMKEKYGTSAEFGAWWRTRVAYNDMLDLGFSLYIPQNPQEFTYTYRGEALPTNAIGVSGMVGMRFCNVYVLGGKTSLEWVSSYGYAFFTYYDEYRDRHYTDPPVTPAEDEENENTVDLFGESYARALSTFHIGQGVRLHVGRVSFYAAYNFAPYGFFSNNVPDNFGSHSVSVCAQVRI